jgi:hypothetical protein
MGWDRVLGHGGIDMSTEDLDIFNGHYEVQVTIDSPVAEVWKQFINLGSWVTSHVIEQVSGAANTVGSVTRVSYKKAAEQQLPQPHHHYCKVVKAVPEKQYLLKTYSEKGGSYGMEMVAFDDTRFDVIDGKTRVTFNIYVQRKTPGKDTSTMNLDGSREGMVKNLDNLKRMLEGRRG